MTAGCPNRADGAPTGALTFGVEEEFLLVDPHTRASAPRAEAVIEATAEQLGDRVQREFFATQVEVCTRPVADPGQLRAELVDAREAAAGGARRAGCLLVASASAVLTQHPLPITDRARYHGIAGLLGPAVADADGEFNGCHIHLGSFTRAEAVTLSNHFRPWLPILQAASANSPFCGGRDRGFCSWRSVQYTRWPTVGPAPVLNEAAYELLAEQLVSSGTLLDRRMIYWYARPSEHLPTLEIRVADVNADVDTTVLLAVLARGLAQVLLSDIQRGRPCPQVTDSQLWSAHRQAARYGLHGRGTDPDTGERLPMRRLLQRLVERSAAGLEVAGDLGLARALTARLLADGTGADRQRAAYRRRRSLSDVVDELAAVTMGRRSLPGELSVVR